MLFNSQRRDRARAGIGGTGSCDGFQNRDCVVDIDALIDVHIRGGKGIACTTGVILAVCPPAVICCAVGFLIIVGITRYVSVGSIFLVSAYLVQAIIFGQIGWLKISGASRIEFYILSACFTGMAIWRHRANIVRLMNGTENKFGTKKGDK